MLITEVRGYSNLVRPLCPPPTSRTEVARMGGTTRWMARIFSLKKNPSVRGHGYGLSRKKARRPAGAAAAPRCARR